MKNFLKYLLPLAALAVTCTAFAAEVDLDADVDIHDQELDYFKAYREQKVEEDAHDEALDIGGEVKARWKHVRKSTNGIQTRGSNPRNPIDVPGARPGDFFNLPVGAPLPETCRGDMYEVEAVLDVNYNGCKDWVETRFKFKNFLGVESGTADHIGLERAWFGYNFFETNCARLDAEIGRKRISDLFDSRIEFDNFYDGFLVSYENTGLGFGDAFIHGGPFIVDMNFQHYAWAVELGAYNMWKTGFYAKYSYVDWDPFQVDDEVSNSPRFRFQNSQVLAGYRFEPGILCSNAHIYAAFLINTAAKKVDPVLPSKDNTGWYAGIELGKLEKQGDWLVDVCYQYVGYVAVPHFDVSGISRGNQFGFDTAAVTDPSNPEFFDPADGVKLVPAADLEGNANYKGVAVKAYYNATEDITLKGQFQCSRPVNKAIGGTNNYNDVRLEAIYTF